jgi:hypothetical protein
MTEEQIVEFWTMFENYIDKKQMNLCVEKYVDMIIDFGVDDQTLKGCIGHSTILDSAIYYYFEMDEDDEYNEDWDE